MGKILTAFVLYYARLIIPILVEIRQSSSEFGTRGHHLPVGQVKRRIQDTVPRRQTERTTKHGRDAGFLVVRNQQCSLSQFRQEKGNLVIRLDPLVEPHGHNSRRCLARRPVRGVRPLPLGGLDEIRIVHQQPDEHVVENLARTTECQALLRDLLDLPQETCAADLVVDEQVIFRGDLQDVKPD